LNSVFFIFGQEMLFEDIALLFIIGVKRPGSLAAKAAWVATLAEHEEDEHLVLLKRVLWWDTALQKRAPCFEWRPGLWRNGKIYGLRSDYARNDENHSPALSLPGVHGALPLGEGRYPTPGRSTSDAPADHHAAGLLC
jgi:hypothetical protein